MAASDSTTRKPRGNYRLVTHGNCRNRRTTPEYTSWKGMKRRCYNPNIADWHLYGGKGVTVCQRWLDGFANFLEDMGPKPSPEHSIERIDGDGNYEKSNCKWATKEEQAQNTTQAKKITFNGETRSLRGWARHIGINGAALCSRLRRGWTLAQALTTRPLPPSRSGGAIMLTHDGQTLSVSGWARKAGISHATLSKRLKRGWTLEKALATPIMEDRIPIAHRKVICTNSSSDKKST